MARQTPILSLQRAEILSLLTKKPRTIAQLSKDMNLGRTTIYHHIKHLKANGLIFMDKQVTKQGQPVIIATNKARPLPLGLIKALKSFEKKFKP